MEKAPRYFYHQDADNRQCVMFALNNLLQLPCDNKITCNDFKNVVKQLINEHASNQHKIISHLLFSKKPPDTCGCDEESWSLSVPLQYLDNMNPPIKYEVCNLSNYQNETSFEKGRFLLLVELKSTDITKTGNHAICVLHGWLLDSLKNGAEKIEMGKFIENYNLKKMWKLLN